MQEIVFLIFFPLAAAILLLLLKNDTARKITVWVASAAIATAAILLAARYFFSPGNQYFLKESELIDTIISVFDGLLALFLIYIGIKSKRYYIAVLAFVQTGLVLFLELTGKMDVEASYHLFSDKLSIIMVVIIAVVGSLIAIYAVGYMKAYHKHHTDYADRRPFFFAVIFLFLSAMFGLVLSNNLVWMYFFWEVTTICSFLLIGYTKTEEAVNNSFRALWMNLLGGLGFALAIVYSVLSLKTLDLHQVVQMNENNLNLLPVTLLAFAGLTKSAQMPFSKWLLGAMVAPTPSSALLHSATMVKAGVYLLIRLSPALGNNLPGYMVMLIGGFTFLMTSLLAISQSDAKKVLAYSTISNLGLIAACAGVGMSESIWAATFLIIFHAVSKSMLFLSVGAVENSTGSRDIEDMHGLIVKMPEMALIMTIGIAGMFLAPFGMLVSKWAALKSFIDSGSMLLVFFLIFGSASTLFYWTKWLGKLTAVLHASERRPNKIKDGQWFSMITHAVLMVGLVLAFPVISKYLIEPFLKDMFRMDIPPVISNGNTNIMIIMMCMIAILPFALRILAFNKNSKIVTSYMSGVNEGDDRGFTDSFGERKAMYLSNWYMENYFGEGKLLKPTLLISSVGIAFLIAIVAGGVLL